MSIEGLRFANRIAIVTGAAGGIGGATAARLMSEGATVVINDLESERIADRIRSLEGLPGEAIPGRGDVTSEEEVSRLVDDVLGRFGRIDILVNNAGGASFGTQPSSFAETTLADWNRTLALNLTGAFLCARAVVPSMLEHGDGHIVSISSLSGVLGQRAGTAYAAAKAGLTGLTASLSKEVRPHGVCVNGIIIGNAPTPRRTPERQVALDSWTHAGRMGEREEFASVIAFLCSPDASYIAGTMLYVDGGLHRLALM